MYNKRCLHLSRMYCNDIVVDMITDYDLTGNRKSCFSEENHAFTGIFGLVRKEIELCGKI